MHDLLQLITHGSYADECYAVQHNDRGIVGMANCGHNTNSSQFYITLKPTPWMDTALSCCWAMEELKECMAVVVAITNQIIC